MQEECTAQEAVTYFCSNAEKPHKNAQQEHLQESKARIICSFYMLKFNGIKGSGTQY